MNYIIDSHHHLWDYNDREFGWIKDDEIRRDFGLSDLREEIRGAGVSGTIAVHARQTIDETDQLLNYCSTTPWLLGVVGWLPLASRNIDEVLEHYCASAPGSRFGTGKRLLIGLRHLIQDEQDPMFLKREDFNYGVSRLKTYGLCYDVLVRSYQLRPVVDFIARHPGQTFIIDHCAKPDIKNHERSTWEIPMRELSRVEHVYCKISGMVTEATTQWKADDFRYYVDCLLEIFGPGRLMFGSDWPACLARVGYKTWKETVEQLLAGISETERSWVMGNTALTAYNIEPAVLSSHHT